MFRENRLILCVTGIYALVFGTRCLFHPSGWLLAGTLLMSGLFLFILYFSRDPERCIPCEPGTVLAPADGRIVEITSRSEMRFCHGEVYVISIFLSLWDVHVNRAPVGGVIAYSEYKKGRFHPAFFKKSSEENEQKWTGIENREGRFLLKQVAGILARRIVCNVYPGDCIVQGQKFGWIRLGSRVEFCMPQSYQVAVHKGQRVRAGETIIGRLSSEK